MMHGDSVADLSLGEAHLYVAVAKADGVVSSSERLRAPGLASASRKVMDVFGRHGDASERIGANVRSILGDPACAGWDADRHLDRAVELLRAAKEAGAWDIELTGHRNEADLLELARLDGYVYKESAFLSRVKERLKELI